MGVKLLNKFLTTNFHNNGVEYTTLEFLKNKKICIDVSIFLYKFSFKKNELLNNIKRMCELFLKHRITPVFVFDGKPPEIKNEIINKRRRNRNNAMVEYNKLLDQYKNKEPPNKIKKKFEQLKKDMVKINKKDISNVKEILNIYGVTYLTATGEADELCYALVNSNEAFGCLSDDMDLFIYGTKFIFRDFDMDNETITYYNLNMIVKKMGMTPEHFRLFCIISGTDYYYSPHNIFYNYKIYNKFLKTNKTSYYFWLIHNKYIDDNN